MPRIVVRKEARAEFVVSKKIKTENTHPRENSMCTDFSSHIYIVARGHTKSPKSQEITVGS